MKDQEAKRERRKLIIGTRKSLLALKQSHWVKFQLEKMFSHLDITLVEINTKGDKILDVPLADVGGKGLFTKEIEEALANGEVDIAVHSMKDVLTDLPQGLHLGSVPRREDPRDVLISKNNITLKDLPHGAYVGTSSLRRKAQILKFRPDLKVVSLRGNLDTRIKKLDKEGLDGIMVAAAGLKRMGWENKISEYISSDIILPATGQGALGIETRVDDTDTNTIVNSLNHEETFLSVSAERAFLKQMEGGCQIPIAALGTIEKGLLRLQGLVASTDGKEVIKDEIGGNPCDGEKMGILLAERLLGSGGKKILDELTK